MAATRNSIALSSEKSTAIVLRLVPWSESSFIVTLLSRDHGRISAVAKGARRLKSPFDGSLDLLSLCSIVFIDKSGDVLDILTESKLLRRFRAGQRSLPALYCGYYIAELLNHATHPDRELAGLFDLTDHTLAQLDEGLDPASTLVRFELLALKFLGHTPQLEQCANCQRQLQEFQPLESNGDRSVVNRRNRDVAFSIPAGGVMCPSCLAGQREIVRLGRESIEAMQGILQWDWHSGDTPTLAKESYAEIRQLMNRIVSTVLDRRMIVSQYIDSLMR